MPSFDRDKNRTSSEIERRRDLKTIVAYLREWWRGTGPRDRQLSPAADEAEPVSSPEPGWNPGPSLEPTELHTRLRWLLTQSAGTIAEVAHELETRDRDVDDRALEGLRDDALVVEQELTVLRALLGGHIDWDAAYERLLAGEIPPLETDADEAGH